MADEGVTVDVTRLDISPNPAPLGAELNLEVRNTHGWLGRRRRACCCCCCCFFTLGVGEKGEGNAALMIYMMVTKAPRH